MTEPSTVKRILRGEDRSSARSGVPPSTVAPRA